jgi:hypothetical protein
MTTVTTIKEAGLGPPPGIPALRAARHDLYAAVNGGAQHLAELRDLVEDQLIEALIRARREREGTER